MASSPLNPKVSFHVRSISLPSTSHPLILSVEENLCRLRSSEATSCSSSTFDDLSDLLESVEDLVSQKAATIDRSNRSVTDVLDGSLRLLDICSSIREVFLQFREAVQDLQSALRRKRESLETEVGVYMIARKQLRKKVQKCSSDLKKAIKKNEDSIIRDESKVIILSVLKEVESITLSTFKSLLSGLQTRTSSWSLVSKLKKSKGVSSDGEEANIFELEKVHISLATLLRKKSSNGIQVLDAENVQKTLKEVELSMQIVDDKLECIYKSLIRTRFSLLNILSQ